MEVSRLMRQWEMECSYLHRGRSPYFFRDCCNIVSASTCQLKDFLGLAMLGSDKSYYASQTLFLIALLTTECTPLKQEQLICSFEYQWIQFSQGN